MDIGQRIREAQAGWTPERIAHAQRSAVYAVATAHEQGHEELSEIRFAAETEDESYPVVCLARWFDAATYPLPAQMSPLEALDALDDQGFDPGLVRAFKAVQPLIQPAGLE